MVKLSSDAAVFAVTDSDTLRKTCWVRWTEGEVREYGMDRGITLQRGVLPNLLVGSVLALDRSCSPVALVAAFKDVVAVPAGWELFARVSDEIDPHTKQYFLKAYYGANVHPTKDLPAHEYRRQLARALTGLPDEKTHALQQDWSEMLKRVTQLRRFRDVGAGDLQHLIDIALKWGG